MAFGPRIVGKEKYQKTVVAKKGKAGFGPRVTGKNAVAPAAETPAVEQAAPETVGMSIEQIKEAIRENPAFFEALYTQELERSEGPRREALLALKTVAPDEETQGEIDTVLSDIAPKGSSHADAEKARIESLSFPDLKTEAGKRGLDVKNLRSKKSLIDALLAAL